MSYSLNEVEAMAKKATRGARYSWGMAEDASKATRWLCAHGLDGCGALAAMLQQFEDVAFADRTPAISSVEWLSKGGLLCPLITGTALADRAHAIKDRLVIAGPVASPALLFPFVANMAASGDGVVTMDWTGGSAVTDGSDLCLEGSVESATKDAIHILRGGQMGRPTSMSTRARPHSTDWDILNAFAHRTYAPATEESRLRGAGTTEGY